MYLEDDLVSRVQAEVSGRDIAKNVACILSKPPSLIFLPGEYCQLLSFKKA